MKIRHKERSASQPTNHNQNKRDYQSIKENCILSQYIHHPSLTFTPLTPFLFDILTDRKRLNKCVFSCFITVSKSSDPYKTM